MDINVSKLLPLALSGVVNKESITTTLHKAYMSNREETIQMLLYIRDKNNGAGLRDFTRECLLWIKKNDEPTFDKNKINFVLIGRWDDIFFSRDIINDHTLSIIESHLHNGDTLLKKWLPKESSNRLLARFIAKGITNDEGTPLTMKQYRNILKIEEGEFINTLYRPINSYQVTL